MQWYIGSSGYNDCLDVFMACREWKRSVCNWRSENSFILELIIDFLGWKFMKQSPELKRYDDCLFRHLILILNILFWNFQNLSGIKSLW